MYLTKKEALNSHKKIIDALMSPRDSKEEVIFLDRVLESHEKDEYLYDPKSRIDDTEVFCSGEWHHLSGKDFSPEFHSTLNLYYDQYIRELSPNHSFDDLSSRKEFTSFINNINEIAGHDVTKINLSITGYGAELKLHGNQSCPTNFSLVNIYTESSDNPDPFCIKICFSGEIVSDSPIVI